MESWEKMVNMIKQAYIETLGEGRWNSMTDKEKHDAVMLITKDMLKAIDR
jgi:hypothetical protein